MTSWVRSLLLLPSVFIDTGQVQGEQNRSNLRANAYGALAELDFAMSQHLDPVNYPDGRRILRDNAPFRSCYLVGNQTEDGAIVGDFETVLEKSAVHLMIELASKIRDTGEATLDNTISRIASSPASQGRCRLYSSFSGDWLELPSGRVIGRWRKAFAARLLDRLGSRTANTAVVDGAFDSLGHEEPYGTFRQLIRGSGLGAYMPRVDAVRDVFLDIGTEAQAADLIVQRAQALESDASRQIEGNQHLEERTREAIERIPASIEAGLRDMLQVGSLADARAFVARVQTELDEWSTRTQEGEDRGDWVTDLNSRLGAIRPGILQPKAKHLSDQRELVLDANRVAEESWRARLKDKVRRVSADALPAVRRHVRELRDRLESRSVLSVPLRRQSRSGRSLPLLLAGNWQGTATRKSTEHSRTANGSRVWKSGRGTRSKRCWTAISTVRLR